MLLKVGELAKRSGLTVRTLHHYDSIGLVKPSARSDAGYRLYNRDDIARLHQVQALQRLGLSLAEIGAALASPHSQLPQIIAQQLQMLDRQLEQATRLRKRLEHLQTQLLRGDEPELADWLKTLELMSMYDKYFTPEELKRLPPNFDNVSLNAEWTELVKTVRELMDSHTQTDDPRARDVAQRWFEQVQRDVVSDPRLLAKLSDMYLKEPMLQTQTGITPEVIHYIQQASLHDKFDIYKRYLTPDEFAFLKDNYGKRISEWPPLIAAVYEAMHNGIPVESAETRKLALQWLDLFRSYAGDNPDTHAKFRNAHEQEPALMTGSLITPELLNYMRSAFAQLRPA